MSQCPFNRCTFRLSISYPANYTPDDLCLRIQLERISPLRFAVRLPVGTSAALFRTSIVALSMLFGKTLTKSCLSLSPGWQLSVMYFRWEIFIAYWPAFSLSESLTLTSVHSKQIIHIPSLHGSCRQLHFIDCTLPIVFQPFAALCVSFWPCAHSLKEEVLLLLMLLFVWFCKMIAE